MELSELSVLIVDCQATGASPAHGVVLEIGWGVTTASRPGLDGLEAHWVQLPEGLHVSSTIRRLTGFDEAAVSSALEARTAWERLRGALAPAHTVPTAIHFAQFELPFLRDWAERFEPAAGFPLDIVCVHAIARRLYPDLPRRSLRALAGFLGHGVSHERKSLAHVEATAFIWQKLVPELAQRDVRTWSELGRWMAEPAPVLVRPKKRRYPLPSERYRALPDAPGVYHLLRSNGDLLYVGKAASLRKRVASHFTSVFARTERALEMLTQVHDLQVTPTASALEAALLENERIKALAPPYNVQLVVSDARIWFVNAALDSAVTAPDAQHRNGPLPSTYSVRALGGVRALLAGAEPTGRLRALAVGAPERWAPDEPTFAAGWSLFRERHGLGVEPRALVLTARRLLSAPENGAATDAEEQPRNEGASPAAWDPERVARHLEREIAHGYQLLMRARWLCLLADSTVLFREPGSAETRLLRVRACELVETRTLPPRELLQMPLGRSAPKERREDLARHRYDRLRTLTTELKRVMRDGGWVEVGLGRAHWLRGERLAAALRWV